MADRVSATITIGGSIDRAKLLDLTEIIQSEGLSTDWDGEEFALSQIVDGEPLRVMAHDVAWGRFEGLEQFCIDEALPFVRWSGSHGGQWGAERLVFTGNGQATRYPCSEDDDVVIGREHLERIGSIEGVMAYFDAASFTVPPLRST